MWSSGCVSRHSNIHERCPATERIDQSATQGNSDAFRHPLPPRWFASCEKRPKLSLGCPHDHRRFGRRGQQWQLRCRARPASCLLAALQSQESRCLGMFILIVSSFRTPAQALALARVVESCETRRLGVNMSVTTTPFYVVDDRGKTL